MNGAIAIPKNINSLTIILYNSENNIHDIKPFCCPLFCHSSVVKYSLFHLSYSMEAVMRLEFQILLIFPPITLLARSAPAIVL